MGVPVFERNSSPLGSFIVPRIQQGPSNINRDLLSTITPNWNYAILETRNLVYG